MKHFMRTEESHGPRKKMNNSFLTQKSMAKPKKAGINRSGNSCRRRWLSYLRPLTHRGDFSQEETQLTNNLHNVLDNNMPNAKRERRAWTKEEDDRLIKYIKAHGPCGWINIAKAAGIRRSSSSCRGRWMNHLRPDIKHEKFTKEEEEKIIKIHNTIGNRWSIMARHLPQRSASDIRNYWRFVIMKKYFWGEIDGHLINPNMPTICDRNLCLVLKTNEEIKINKAAGISTQQNYKMNIDQQLNLELTLNPPGA